MALLAGIRASGFQFHKGYDVTWDLGWKYMEACVGCCMVSLSAFRSLFVPGSARAWRERNRNRGPSTHAQREIWRRFKDPNRKVQRRVWTFGSAEDGLSVMPAVSTLGRADSAEKVDSAVGASAGGLPVSGSMLVHPKEIKSPRRSDTNGALTGDYVALSSEQALSTHLQTRTIEDVDSKQDWC